MTGGAAVGGNNQINVVGSCIATDMLRLDAVTLGDPVGDIIGNIGSGMMQKIEQDHRGRDAVDIIVAKNQDFFLDFLKILWLNSQKLRLYNLIEAYMD